MPIAFSEITKLHRVRPVANGAALTTVTLPEAASSNFRKDELVIISTSGGVDYVTQMVAIPATNSTLSSSLADTDLIYGIARKSATGVTGTPIPVLVLDGQVEMLVRLYNATASASQPQDVAIGDLTELFRYRGTSATDVFTVCSPAPNGTAAINKAVIVEKYSIDDTTVNSDFVGSQSEADTYGAVWVRFRSSLMAETH